MSTIARLGPYNMGYQVTINYLINCVALVNFFVSRVRGDGILQRVEWSCE